MNFRIFLLIIAIIFAGCATNDITLQVIDPAPVTIPIEIKNVGIINRTNTVGNPVNETIDSIEQLMTLGLVDIDSEAIIFALNGLKTELLKNPRFTEVKDLTSPVLDNNLANNFSIPIEKNKIIQICNDNGLDAIYVLEFFDTKSSIKLDAKPVTQSVLGKKVTLIKTFANVNTLILIGWKIYDSSGDIIYDQLAVNKNVISTGSGINPMNAINAVVGQKDRVKSTVFDLGVDYANDILPFKHPVGRIYFVKGSPNFKIGKRMARAGNWTEAANYWQKEINNPKRKIAGRAYFNMAVASEINGDIDVALEWCEKSYTMFNNKKALDYLNVLKYRKSSLELLKRQTGEN